jgi:hypothetical protein
LEGGREGKGESGVFSIRRFPQKRKNDKTGERGEIVRCGDLTHPATLWHPSLEGNLSATSYYSLKPKGFLIILMTIS